MQGCATGQLLCGFAGGSYCFVIATFFLMVLIGFCRLFEGVLIFFGFEGLLPLVWY